MKKDELKKVLKPLIKECVKEMLIDGDLLGNVITEVIRGMGTQPVITEATRVQPASSNVDKLNAMNAIRQERESVIREIEAEAYSDLQIGGVNVFEGTTPLGNKGTALTEGAAPTQSGPANPLADVDPNDPGINISGILNVAGGAGKWAALAKAK